MEIKLVRLISDETRLSKANQTDLLYSALVFNMSMIRMNILSA